LFYFTGVKKKIYILLKCVDLEATIWATGLLLLALMQFGGESHFTICPIKNLGFDFCPGCGLGYSIHHLFHFDLQSSFAAHPLGIIALPLLLQRIYVLTKSSFIRYKTIVTNY